MAKKNEDLKAYTSTVKALRVTGPEGTIQFANGFYQTEDKAIQKMIESTPSYGDSIKDAEARAENDVDVLDAKKADAKAEPKADAKADAKKPEADPGK